MRKKNRIRSSSVEIRRTQKKASGRARGRERERETGGNERETETRDEGDTQERGC